MQIKQNLPRRLTTLLVTDIVGFSRMMEIDEERTARNLEHCMGLIQHAVNATDGRVFNQAGDAALAEFPSPVNALRCAVQIRETIINNANPDIAELRLRTGIHLADVIVKDKDLIGDGVNIAARIQQNAEPDTILVSDAIYENVKRNSPYNLTSIGPVSFKNISEAITLYLVTNEVKRHVFTSPATKPEGTGRITESNSIAILPIKSDGRDEDQTYFAEGLTEELIVELGRIRRLHVASRTATSNYLNRDVDPTVVARELGVAFVLEGATRRMGKTVRLSLTLVDGETGKTVWSDRITRQFEDLFELLDEVVSRMAALIMGRVEQNAIEAARRKRPENMQAYDYVLRGLDYHRLGGVSMDNLRQAVSWFDKAIKCDPNLGSAYAWRICAASSLPEFELSTNRRYIEKSIELDPNNPEAQRIMGFVSLLDGNFEKAEYHHKKALELSPCDAYILSRCAAFYSFIGEPEKALTTLERAIELDPLLPLWCMEERGIAFYVKSDYTSSVKAFTELPFQSSRSRLYQALAHHGLNNTALASLLIKESNVINPELTASNFMSKEPYKDKSFTSMISSTLISLGLKA